MLVKSDYTLRRYQTSDDVDSDAPSKMPRSYRLSELEFIANDAVPRFYLQMKSHSLGGAGEQVKLSAETDSERKQWMKAIADLKAAIPPEEDDDPYRESCARALRVLLNGGSALAHPLPTAAACCSCSRCCCSRVHTRYPTARCRCCFRCRQGPREQASRRRVQEIAWQQPPHG